MKKITHYRTVSAAYAGLLDDVVNELIGQGYQPYGNPYAAGRVAKGDKVEFITRQAMVLMNSRPPNPNPKTPGPTGISPKTPRNS